MEYITELIALGAGTVALGSYPLPPLKSKYKYKCCFANTPEEKLGKKKRMELAAEEKFWRLQICFSRFSSGVFAKQHLYLYIQGGPTTCEGVKFCNRQPRHPIK